VKNPIGAFESRLQNIRLHDITAHVVNLDARIFHRVMEVFTAAAHEVVVDQDFLDVFLDQMVNGVRSDQTCTTHKNEFFATDVHYCS
jgi:hypothetical protein